MPRRLSIVLALLVSIVLASAFPGRSSAQPTDFMVYKVTVKIVAQMDVPGPNFDTLLTEKLGNNDVINLALGRPLGTKIDPGIILAGAGNFEPRTTNSPIEKLIVFDPSQNGVAQVVAAVGTATSLTYQGGAVSGSKSQGSGFGSGTILDTTLGNPAENGFLTTTLNGGGQSSGGHLGVSGGNIVFPSITGVGSASGPLKFNFTDKNGSVTLFDGIIVKAQGKVSGKPIGSFSE
jgi:hypothetical protein